MYEHLIMTDLEAARVSTRKSMIKSPSNPFTQANQSLW